MPEIRIAALDLDGTLLDTIGDLAAAANAVCRENGWQEYTVQKGDSLSKISERYYGTMSRVKDICELNQIAVEDLIYAGQKIYLPK